MDYLAICTRCKKSIFVEINQAGEYYCPACKENFGFDIKSKVDFLVDADLSNQAYEVGQEYFNNTDFREAAKYYKRAIQINYNHYPAVYQLHMCNIYEQEQYNDTDISPLISKTIIDCVDRVLMARVSNKSRINFLATVLKQSYIMLSKYYSRKSNDLIAKEDWGNLRVLSINLAAALIGIVSIDKEAIFASNPSIVTSCLGIADIGISACQFSIIPRLDNSRTEAHILDMPTESQYKVSKNMCQVFMSYAQSLDASFSCSQKTDYGPALFFIDQYVVPKRKKYYAISRPTQKRCLSMPGELLNTLVADSTFAARFAHRLCFKEFLHTLGDESRRLLVFESVDNCIDSLMPRFRIGQDKKLDILCKGYDGAVQITGWFNDFLYEMSKTNNKYAAQKVDWFFGVLYNSIKKYYDKVSKKYASKVNNGTNPKTADIKYYFSFLYQVTKCGMLGFLIDDFDKDIENGNRSKLLDIAKIVVNEFVKLNQSNLLDIYTSKFIDIDEVFSLINDAQIYYKDLTKKQCIQRNKTNPPHQNIKKVV